MIEQMAKKAGESVWRKVGEKAVITAVTTLLTETIKASVELVKEAKLRQQKAEFSDRRDREKKARDPDGGADTPKEDRTDDEQDEPVSEDKDVDEESDAAESDAPPIGTGPKVDFASYVATRG